MTSISYCKYSIELFIQDEPKLEDIQEI